MNKVFYLTAACALAQDPRQIVEEVQKRTRADSQRYQGTLEVQDGRNRVTTKRWQYDRLGSFGDSKAALRFTAPAEVKGVALLIHNHTDTASDQWMWTPELQRERRILFQNRSTRFFGTDFSFEDLEERDAKQFEYKLLGEDAVDGAPCWKIESRPGKRKASQYTHSHLWVRKDLLVFAQVEAFKDRQLQRRIRYRDYEKVKNIWTAKTIEVYDDTRKSRTILKIGQLDYNLSMKDEDFTLQSLRRGS